MHKTITLSFRAWIVRAWLLAMLLSISLLSIAQTPQYTVGGTTGSANSWPFNATSTSSSNQVELLYFPTHTNSTNAFNAPPPAGFITAVYFVPRSNTSPTHPDVFIKMGNTSLTTLPSGSWTSTAVTQVYYRSSVTLTPTSGQWMKFDLDVPFYYDGTSNIIVQMGHTGSNSGFTLTFNNGSPLTRTYGRSINSNVVGTDQEVYSFGIDIFAGFPCTDTPKTSIAGPHIVCPNKQFNLRPDSFYADATYQWQYSNNGQTWSNVTQVPGLYGDINDAITTAKWYRVKVTCDANTNLTWTSPPHKVDIAPFYYCYCDNLPKVTDPIDIGNVTLINLQSFDTVVNNGLAMPLYNNTSASHIYTPMHDSISWPCLYRDTTYRFLITQIQSVSTLQSSYAQVYIDFNRDGQYNPNTEKLFVAPINGSGVPPEIADVNYKIPSGAEIGPTGMRVIISKDTLQTVPCDTIPGGGEIEDYIVKICHRPCDGPVNAGTVVSTDTSMCPDYEYKLTDTTYEKARSAFTRAWQVSGDNISWFNVDGGIDKDTLQRVFTGQPLYYRLRTVCPSTLDTVFSGPTLVNAKPGYKCYCYSKATGGFGVDSSDIGSIAFGGISTYDGGPHIMNLKAVEPRTDHTDDKFQEFYTDSTYAFYVYHTMNALEHGDAKVTIFMDFNNNKEYDIPEERIYTGYTTIGSHTLVDSIKIPTKAIRDVPTGARFIINNDIAPSRQSDSACGGYLSGETEDFIVIFRKKIPKGINDVGGKLSGFGVHPNPTTGNFTLSFDAVAAVEDVQVRITNMTGQTVFTQQYNVGGTEFTQEIELNGQPAGVYFVELNADGERLIRKLMIQ